VAVPGRGVHAPFEDVARDHERSRDDAIRSDLCVRTDIDQGRARTDRKIRRAHIYPDREAALVAAALSE
jgi:hypothetical protein